jgi:hypothetical protein
MDGANASGLIPRLAPKRVKNIMKQFRVILFLLAFAISIRAAVPPAENLLPSDTLLVLTIPDFTALKTAAHQSPQFLFWNDPAMKPFHDKFMAKLNDTLVTPLERDLGIKFSDFEQLPQGQLTFAVTRNGWSGNDEDPDPGALLLLDAGDKSDLLKTNLAALTKKWTDDGKSLHTETVRGIPFSVVPLSSNDVPSLSGMLPKRPSTQELGKDPKPDKARQLVIGQSGSLLIVGNSLAAVEPVVAHLSGSGAPALSEDAGFAADKLSQFREAPLYYGWFNANTFFYILSRITPDKPNPQAPNPFGPPPMDKILAATGLTGLKSISFSYRETSDGSQVNFFISAPQSARKGLFKIFSAAHESAAPPAFVPADAVKFWRWRIDGQDGWAALQKMVGDISPMGLSGLNAALDMANANAQQKNPGFDIRKNLIGNLGDDFVGYTKAPLGKSPAETAAAPSLFLIGVENGDQAVVAMNSLTTAMFRGGRQKAPEPRDFQGHKIYTIPLPGQQRGRGAATADDSQRSLYCATSGGYVAITTDVSMIEEYLRSSQKPPKPLSGTPGLVDASSHVGGVGGGIFGYENQRETMRALFNMLKSQGADASMPSLNPFMPKTGGIKDWLDFSLLPEYDTVSKYFFFSVYSGTATSDGLSFKAFAPRPPHMN